MSTSEPQMNEVDKQCRSVQECESGVLLHHPTNSCVKQWLLLFRNATSNKDRQGPNSPPRCRQRLLLAIIILFGLTIMVLLLLWNYQCIFIERLCREHEESSVFSVFERRVPTSTAGSLD